MNVHHIKSKMVEKRKKSWEKEEKEEDVIILSASERKLNCIKELGTSFSRQFSLSS